MRDGNSILGAYTKRARQLLATYEGWKPGTGPSHKKGGIVVSLPMRDGNSLATITPAACTVVVSLPMRDGNLNL